MTAVASGERRSVGFREAGIDRRLADDGYALLDRRISTDAVDALAALYEGVVEAHGRDRGDGFVPSMTIDRPDLRARLWDGVCTILGPELRPILDDRSEVYGGSFVFKPASERSARQPHQDPTVFDEREQVSLSVWIPLVDSTVENGTIHVLPASHRMGNRVRPPDVESFDDEVSQVALAESVALEVAAGQILVLDGELIHHSPPNRSDRDRVAVIGAVRPLGAEMVVVRSEGGASSGHAEVSAVADEHYRSGDLSPHAPAIGARPVGTFPYRPAGLGDLAASRRPR